MTTMTQTVTSFWTLVLGALEGESIREAVSLLRSAPSSVDREDVEAVLDILNVNDGRVEGFRAAKPAIDVFGSRAAEWAVEASALERARWEVEDILDA